MRFFNSIKNFIVITLSHIILPKMLKKSKVFIRQALRS